MEQRAFPRSLGALDDLFAWLSCFAARERIDDGATFAVKFAVEEIFVNMIRYNPGGAERIVIGLSRQRDRLEVSLTDVETTPFDITEVAEYDGGLPLEKRRPGGLGIHLTRKLMDGVAYAHENGRSTITLTKTLGAVNV